MSLYRLKAVFVQFLLILACIFSDIPLPDLLRAANRRKRNAFRPGTTANHKRFFTSYLEFCIKYNLRDVNPSVDTVCMYAEYLANRFSSPLSVRNYIGGVRLLHRYLNVVADSLSSFELDLMLRALDLTMLHIPTQKSPVTERMLLQLCCLCDDLGLFGDILKFAFLLGFFGFLRASNIAPPYARAFDPTRHTCRGDVIFQPPGLVVILKWTKTSRCYAKPYAIPLPTIPDSPLCPVQAYRNMLSRVPTHSAGQPLLVKPSSSDNYKVVTSCQLRRGFTALVECLGYPTGSYSLHSLRRGGATAAYNANVDYINIKRHGTWRSDTFWQYIAQRDVSASPVASGLARAVQGMTI